MTQESRPERRRWLPRFLRRELTDAERVEVDNYVEGFKQAMAAEIKELEKELKAESLRNTVETIDQIRDIHAEHYRPDPYWGRWQQEILLKTISSMRSFLNPQVIELLEQRWEEQSQVQGFWPEGSEVVLKIIKGVMEDNSSS